MKQTTLNLSKEIEKISEKYQEPELILCKGLKQPFNNTKENQKQEGITGCCF